MEFTAPAAGSYVLQHIQSTPDALLLDSSGRLQHLAWFMHGKVTLLTFFYTYCVDPLGCPFARQTLGELRERIIATPGLASSVRFVNVSLDPSMDTPDAIARYAREVGMKPAFEWRVLTAPSVGKLLPLLDDFGQDVSIDKDAEGKPMRALHHMLKVFLIDPKGTVREIYSIAFMQPDVMFNDIRTLAMEAHR
jgi:protein SCO1